MPTVRIEDAKNYKEQMAKPDLVFLNHENETEILKRAAPHVRAELEKRLDKNKFIKK